MTETVADPAPARGRGLLPVARSARLCPSRDPTRMTIPRWRLPHYPVLRTVYVLDVGR